MPRTVSDKSAASAGDAPAGPSLVNAALRRFPWPADPRRRYGFESPYLAVVNARGPWAVWRHRSANPPFVPLCLDLLDKGFWRAADDGQRVFALTVWARAAKEDDWGIVWGDPVRLVHEWSLDASTFVERLDWMIESGLAVYLTHEEAAAARSWRPGRGRSRREGGETKGGTIGGNLEEGEGQASSSQDKQDQGQASQDKQDGSLCQAAGSARAHSDSQLPDSKGKTSKTSKTSKSKSKSKAKQAEQGPTASQGQAQAANLPKSDPGSKRPKADARNAAIGARTPADHSGSDAVRIGQILSAKQAAWHNPLAVDFARHMVGAITGRACVEDLTAASDRLLMDLGPWVYFWVERVQNTLSAGDFEAFRARCVKDIGRKKRCRGIRNLGGLAMKVIVPGVLAAMTKGM